MARRSNADVVGWDSLLFGGWPAIRAAGCGVAAHLVLRLPVLFPIEFPSVGIAWIALRRMLGSQFEGSSMGQVPDWCVRLQDSDLDVRANAAEALSLLGPDAAFAAVELVAACADQEVVREYAVAALEGMGPPPEERIAGLIGLLSHRDPLVLYWAVTLLGRVRESSDEIEEAVAVVAQDSSDLAVRQRAVWALGNMRPLLPATRSMLQVLRASEDPRLARLATHALDSP